MRHNRSRSVLLSLSVGGQRAESSSEIEPSWPAHTRHSTNEMFIREENDRRHFSYGFGLFEVAYGNNLARVELSCCRLGIRYNVRMCAMYGACCVAGGAGEGRLWRFRAMWPSACTYQLYISQSSFITHNPFNGDERMNVFKWFRNDLVSKQLKDHLRAPGRITGLTHPFRWL